MEVALDRLGGFLEQEQAHDGEGGGALAGEVSGARRSADRAGGRARLR